MNRQETTLALASYLTKLTHRVRRWTGPGFLDRERRLFNRVIGEDRCGPSATDRRPRRSAPREADGRSRH